MSKESLASELMDMKKTKENKVEEPFIEKTEIALNDGTISSYIDDYISEFVNKNPKDKLNDVVKQLLANIKYLDEQIKLIENQTASYDKFSRSVSSSKLEYVQERTRLLEILSKLAMEEIENDISDEGVNSLSDIFNK
jgi:hypothetical protein